MSAIGSACCSVAWDYSSLLASALETGVLEKSASGAVQPCNDSSCPIRDWLDLSATGLEAATTSASASLQSVVSNPEYEDATEDTEVTENIAYSPISSLGTLQENSEEEPVAPLARMSVMSMSSAEVGSVELVTEKRNDVATLLRDLLGGTAFNTGGAKFSITYNFIDNKVTVGGNISTTAKTALQNVIDADTSGDVAAAMQDLYDSLGLDTDNDIVKRNFTLSMTSLADISANDVSYNLKVKITPNTGAVPAGNTVPTVTYNAQIGGALQTFNAANYPNLTQNGNIAAAVTNSTISLLNDDSGLKHDWTLTKFLLTEDGKIRGTMTVTGNTKYLFGTIPNTPPTEPGDPGDEEQDVDLEDPGAGNVTIDAFIQSIMTKTGGGQGDVLQWLTDSLPWYDPSVGTNVLSNINSNFKTALQDWYAGGTNSDVTGFLQSNGLTNVVKPL